MPHEQTAVDHLKQAKAAMAVQMEVIQAAIDRTDSLIASLESVESVDGRAPAPTRAPRSGSLTVRDQVKQVLGALGPLGVKDIYGHVSADVSEQSLRSILSKMEHKWNEIEKVDRGVYRLIDTAEVVRHAKEDDP